MSTSIALVQCDGCWMTADATVTSTGRILTVRAPIAHEHGRFVHRDCLGVFYLEALQGGDQIGIA